MAREMREEDARNSLVYFTDARDGKDIQEFGIDLGCGLPEKSRRVFWCQFSEISKVSLLDERHPLVTIRSVTSDEQVKFDIYFQWTIRKYMEYMHKQK